MNDNCIDRLEKASSEISKRNGALKIVTDLDAEKAFEAAKASEKRRQEQKGLGPLDGLILAVKDNISVCGLRWSAGLGAWKNRIATKDARVVKSLRDAGAIVFTMVNMHEGALGATTNNPHFGRTANPLDFERTPGGSSGGSAAAIAAGLADAALGTDTMGSVRIPAAYCGVIGLKPTCGLVPRDGLHFLSPSLDTIGPMAPDIDTLGYMIKIMAGVSKSDPLSRSTPLEWMKKPIEANPSGIIIGIPRQINLVNCEASVIDSVATTRIALEKYGIKVMDVDVSGWNPSRARRAGLLVTEAEGAVALKNILDRPGQDLMSNELRSLLAYGRDAPRNKLIGAYKCIKATAAAATKVFEKVDALLMPTAPQRAFRHSDAVPNNQADFTSLANFFGGPSLAIPVPSNNLPNSVQIIGPEFSEALILSIGKSLEQKSA